MTSIEWLFEELFNSFEKFNNGEISFNKYLSHNLIIREQAKEMHKKEIGNKSQKIIGEHTIQMLEISDEEIEKGARQFTVVRENDFINGAKWYREQLKIN